ncbi:MAG: CPBP family intramembrane glutamic endopeptidase [bacterium]
MKSMVFGESLVFFGIPMILLYFATHLCIPALSKVTGLPIVLAWFICGGTLVFLPMFVAAFILYHREGNPWKASAILERFRLDKMSKSDIAWSVLGILSVGLLTYGILEIGQSFIPGYSAQPSFMSMQPLQANERWILAAWIPFFFFNIFGEGLFWRGYIFPRQELAFRKRTWLVHGVCWTIFHLAFGGALLVTLLPIIFITSFIVQKTRNTWTDIIIHTFINGSGFLLVAFGVVG